MRKAVKKNQIIKITQPLANSSLSDLAFAPRVKNLCSIFIKKADTKGAIRIMEMIWIS